MWMNTDAGLFVAKIQEWPTTTASPAQLYLFQPPNDFNT
jgi:hypothetical protein